MRLGDLQLRILRVLWERSPASVADVRKRLEGEKLAYTTIATMLRKMEERSLVQHVEQGRKFLYAPLVSEQQVSHSVATDFVDRMFEGRLADAVSHLLRTREVDATELDALEQLIRERKADREASS